ncbi:FAD-dependent oxidoreductase [Blastococcus litoris]|uniref:FAD-dependent oxidoreductase n=1 Tax=Blastococcus litoris TaxID=2171622 RepID=UPI000E3099B2|nr:FAD-dependent oxidoreductase [Blastococcus litoris]
MAAVVVCGGSVVGLSTAMMLGRAGHRVTVLEADPDGAPTTPAAAWSAWRRKGVPQFQQAHTVFARFREVCDAELPGLTDRLLAAGCVQVDPAAHLPPTLADRSPREGDERLRYVTGRRAVVEAVVAAAAEEHTGITVRRGERAAGLVPGPSAVAGVPHVAGVRLAGGEVLPADLVVDAMGRRTPTAGWLVEMGARPPVVESADRGFMYFTRFFTGPRAPEQRGPALTPMGGFSVLTLEGDNGTWSVTLYAPAHDTPLKALRSPEVFDRLVGACPRQAHWLDGRPASGVLPIAGVLDRYRRFVVDGRPVATGFLAVGDAWACTNPSAGRGLTVGVVHAQLLARAVAEHLDRPGDLALVHDDATERTLTPFYRAQMAMDEARHAEMEALRQGRQPPAPDPFSARLQTAAMVDADVFRALLATVQCLTPPQEAFTRPDVLARITAQEPAPPSPGIPRERLLEFVAA